MKNANAKNDRDQTNEQLTAARNALEQGRFDEARERYEAALLREPDNADIAVELGDLLLSDGAPLAAMQMLRLVTDAVPDDARIWLRLARAVEGASPDKRVARRLYERAASLADGDADIVSAAARGVSNLGFLQASEAMLARAAMETTPEPGPIRELARLHDKAGRIGDAIEGWSQLLALLPNDLEALRRAAELYITREENDRAVELLERAAGIAPNDLKLVVRLAYALYGDGQYEEAAQQFARVVDAVPDVLPLRMQLGRAFVQAGKFEEAVPHLRVVLKAEPRNDDANVIYAAALIGIGKEANGEQRLRDVLRRNPEHPLALVHLAGLQAKHGQVEEAEGRFVKAIEIEPRYASAYFQAAWSGAFTDAERIEAVLEDERLRRHDRMLMHFAAARIHDKRGNAAEAWEHGLKANGLKQVTYDAAARERFVDAMIERFPGGDEPVSGCGSEAPIFIVGMPRSGTSLVERIIGAHPNVVALGERTDVLLLARNMAARIGSEQAYPACAPPAGDSHWRAFGESMLEELPASVAPHMKFTDKMPANAFHIGLIARMFPNARIIHMRRRLLDSCLSCWFTPFVRDHLAWSYDLDDLASYAKAYMRIMDHWRATSPASMLEVDYEALVASPEEQTRALIDFVGLDWNDACLRPDEADASLDTASVYQARKPIYRSSVNRWDKYRPFAGPLLDLEPLADAEQAA